jgi:hypothetical protein
MSDEPLAITIRRCETLSTAQQARVLEIYYASFPPEERSNLAAVLADIAGNDEIVYLPRPVSVWLDSPPSCRWPCLAS